MLEINRLVSRDADFWSRLDRLLSWDEGGGPEVLEAVQGILEQVRARGDAALLELTARLDGRHAASVSELELPGAAFDAALPAIDPAQRSALETAAARIRAYAEHQRLRDWSFTEPDGTVLGQRVTPLERVGMYVPGGKAAYPSTVLMNAVPAKVAGVGELIMVVPSPRGEPPALVLAAAALAGVDRAFTIGGAQAVAALAYGTESVPRVDKIVGPGNAYVAAAKRMVFGSVGIDMVAGPSEVVVVADASGDPAWLAMDLFAQAEHDEDARAVLVSPDAALLARVAERAEALLPGLERRAVIAEALRRRGALVEVRDLAEAAAVVNAIAPEHLELCVADPEALLARVQQAGAVFLGGHSSEALGDYCAGPNHVLPTSRTARFSSPLGVYDFQKRSSVIRCSPEGARRLGAVASVLARGEGLTAHARAAELRLEPAE